MAISYVVRTDDVQKTYDVVYDIVYDVARTTGKNSILTYDIVRRTYDVVYDIVFDICMNRGCLGPIIAQNCLYRPCSTPVILYQNPDENVALSAK